MQIICGLLYYEVPSTIKNTDSCEKLGIEKAVGLVGMEICFLFSLL